jgi:hypothetical protein
MIEALRNLGYRLLAHIRGLGLTIKSSLDAQWHCCRGIHSLVYAETVGDILSRPRGTILCESGTVERPIFQTKELSRGKENEEGKKEAEEEVISELQRRNLKCDG